MTIDFAGVTDPNDMTDEELLEAIDKDLPAVQVVCRLDISIGDILKRLDEEAVRELDVSDDNLYAEAAEIIRRLISNQSMDDLNDRVVMRHNNTRGRRRKRGG